MKIKRKIREFSVISIKQPNFDTEQKFGRKTKDTYFKNNSENVI